MRPGGRETGAEEKPLGWTCLRRSGSALLAQPLPGEGHAGVGVGSVHRGVGPRWRWGGEPPAHVRTDSAHGRGPWRRVAGLPPPRVRARHDPGRASEGATALHPHPTSEGAGELQRPPPPSPSPESKGGCGGHGRGTDFAAQTAWWLRVRGTPSWRGGSARMKLEIPVLADPGPSVAAPQGGERWLGGVPSDSAAA